VHRFLAIGLVATLALALCGEAAAWSWPADGAVLRPFALGADAYAGGQHRGIDVAGPDGSSVRAPASGVVTFAGSLPTYGRGVTILTSDGYAVTLVHLGSIGVEKGDTVSEGATVGTMGTSGTPEASVPSVHLGIRRASEEEGYVDPLGLLPPHAVTAPTSAPDAAPSPAPVQTALPAAVQSPPAAAAPVSSAPPSNGAAPAAAVTPAAASVEAPSADPPATMPAASAPAPAGVEIDRVVGAVAGETNTPGVSVSPAVTGRPVTGRSANVVVDGRVPRAARAAADGARVSTRTHTPRTGGTRAPRHAPSAHAVSAVGRAPAAGGPQVGRRSTPDLASRTSVTDLRDPQSGRAQVVSADSAVASPAEDAARPSVHAHRSGLRAASAPVSTTTHDRAASGGTSTGPHSSSGVGLSELAAALALAVLAAVAVGRRVARRIGMDGAVLRHHADLLRQLDAAHRARLHDRGGGRVRAPSATARS
jgi:peptidase M23-like protein